MSLKSGDGCESTDNHDDFEGKWKKVKAPVHLRKARPLCWCQNEKRCRTLLREGKWPPLVLICESECFHPWSSKVRRRISSASGKVLTADLSLSSLSYNPVISACPLRCWLGFCDHVLSCMVALIGHSTPFLLHLQELSLHSSAMRYQVSSSCLSSIGSAQ